MFGGYDSSFYKGYENIFPLDSGFNSRKTLYNLYHELNHLNLFGRGYELIPVKYSSTCKSNPLKEDIKEVLLDKDAIQERVREIGREIDEHYKGREIIIITLLDGAIVLLQTLSGTFRSHYDWIV